MKKRVFGDLRTNRFGILKINNELSIDIAIQQLQQLKKVILKG